MEYLAHYHRHRRQGTAPHHQAEQTAIPVQGAEGASLRNVTCMQGVLSSPALYAAPAVPTLAQAAAPAARLLSLLLCRARIVAMEGLRWDRVHSCGRGLPDQLRLAGASLVLPSQTGKGAYACSCCCLAGPTGSPAHASVVTGLALVQNSRLLGASHQCDVADRLACCGALPKTSADGRLSDHQQWRCGFCGDVCCEQSSVMQPSAVLRLADNSATIGLQSAWDIIWLSTALNCYCEHLCTTWYCSVC